MSESVKLENLLGMLTIKLNDDNFIKWNFQFCSVLRGYDLFDHFTGESVCPPKYVINSEMGVTKEISVAYKTWVKTDMALLSLLLATLSDDAIEHVVGCKTSHEAWTALQDRYMFVSSASVNHLKAELHTIQKGGDNVDKYLLRLKLLKDKLTAAGEKITDHDVVIAALTGLPAEFDIIRTVILARDTPITLKEFRAQLLGVEKSLENRMHSLVHSMAAMYTNAGFSASPIVSTASASSISSVGSVSQNSGFGFVAPGLSNMGFVQTPGFTQNNSSMSGFQPSGSQFNGQGNNSFAGQGHGNYNGQGNRFNGYRGKGSGGYKSKFNGSRNGSFWSGNTSHKQEIVPECQICSRKGHTAVTCLYRFDNTQVVQECQICGKKGHIAIDCRHRGNYAYQGAPPPVSLSAHYAAPDFSSQFLHSNALSSASFPSSVGFQGFTTPEYLSGTNLSFPQSSTSVPELSGVQGPSGVSSLNAFTAQTSVDGESWIVDTGASHHMSPDIKLLNSVVPYDGDKQIIVGSGQGLSVKNIGHGTLQSPSHMLYLRNILHVPMLTVNLLSVKQLCNDNNSWFICDGYQFFVQDKATGVILYKGKSDHNELFKIPVRVFPSLLSQGDSVAAAFLGKVVKTSLWHHRFGHPSNEVLEAMLRDCNVSVSSDVNAHVCSHCLSGKMSKLSFSEKLDRVDIPFHKVHTDVWGPSPVVSVEGFRYYVSFVDEATRFVWIFPLMNKSEVFGVFVRFCAYVDNQFNTKIKVLQSDGGGEFLSKPFKDYLATHGILHFVSCPYTPQQNGLVERKHRHIIETALTMLHTAKLPLKFWYHAVAHAVLLINRMPARNLSMQSPFGKLFDKKPDLSSMKVFGSAVYPYLRPYTAHKLQPRSTQCVFLGYCLGYKGVLCYNPISDKLVISRHVIHDEGCFPFAVSNPSSTDTQTHSAVSSNVSLRPIMVNLIPSQSNPNVNSTSSQDSGMSNHVQDFNTDVANFDSSVPFSIPSVLHVPSSRQLDVSSMTVSPNSVQVDAIPDNSIQADAVQGIQTRLKTGTITRKDYAALTAVCPQVQTLGLEDCSHFSGGFTFVADISDVSEPSNFRLASQIPQWQQAMQEEYDALQAQGTWTLVPLPPDKNVVGCKWVYKLKRNPDGSISRHKARLVAQGFSQEKGLDYTETFSPVVRHTTVRVLLALAATYKWSLRQLDVKNAFLHGELHDEVYMKQPQGFLSSQYPNHVCKLVKSLYGLKQAPRAWNDKFTSYLAVLGFQASLSDSSLFVKKIQTEIVILLLYVDDIIITGSNTDYVQTVINDLAAVFELKDMGQLTYFLGLQIQYSSSGGIFVNQEKYIKDLIHKAGMDNCKPCSTPCVPHQSVFTHEGDLLPDPKLYRSLVGALQYLTFTRPDIAFAVNNVCQFMNSPTDIHLGLVKRIIRFLQGTLQCGLHFSSGTGVEIKAYSDSDWAADVNTRRSITGYVICLGDNPVSWQSKKQISVSRSSTEAEYKALAHATADICWIRMILKDMSVVLQQPPLLQCDNQSAIALSLNPVQHSRIKHLETDFHFVRERAQKGDLLVQYISTKDQVADVLTKGLHGPDFLRHCANLKLGNPSSD